MKTINKYRNIKENHMKLKVLAALISFVLVQSTMAQDTQYGQGLLLDYHIIQNPDDVKEPTGRSMATLVDTSAPHLEYLSPFKIEPALNQFNDQFWGLHWNGFLKIESGGQYSFNLLFNIAGEGSNRYGAACLWGLQIQDRAIVGHPHDWFSPGNHNAYGDLQLQPGIYALGVWLACSETGDRIANNGQTQAMQIAKPSLTINMRGPNDAMLKPIPKNQLLHEL